MPSWAKKSFATCSIRSGRSGSSAHTDQWASCEKPMPALPKVNRYLPSRT
jgi:hypothetical protein